MTFMWPNRLWWLVLVAVLVVIYVIAVLLKRNKDPKSEIERVLPRQSVWKRHVVVGAALLSIVSLNIAYAVPTGVVKEPRQRATIVVAIDISKSMLAQDVKPNRLQAAQESAIKFVSMVPSGFNVSLVSFAGTAAILVPPTTDRELVSGAIMRLKLAPSTAIGEGIYSSLDAVALAPADPDKPDEPAPAAIVLLSDGSTNMGRKSDVAAREAKKLKVPVYTIAYGRADGYIEVKGAREPVPVDAAELARVARLSGGKAFEAKSSEELKEVYSSIAETIGYQEVEKPITEKFAGYALAMAVLAALGVVSLAARWP